jgi:lipopolysaccharide biosynthesis glycosyltransferase
LNSITCDPLQVELIYVDFKFNADLLPLHGHIDVSTYYRLLIENYLPLDIDKILYLDADVIIDGSIDELFSMNLNGNAIGAVNHNITAEIANKDLITRLNLLGLESEKYFNAGVLLIDYQQWINSNVLSKSLSILKEFSNSLEWWDQDILNIIFKDSVYDIPTKWNYINFCMANLPEKNEKVIYHFAGPHKPWYLFVDVFGKHIFWKYYNLKRFIAFLDYPRFIQNIRLIAIQARIKLKSIA